MGRKADPARGESGIRTGSGPSSRPQAVLILGPTGCGKTPLGREIENRGLVGRRCRHFDFGAEMRALAARDPEGVLTEAETAVVRRSLSEGSLLEDRDFPIAGKILEKFLRRESAGTNDIVILNGLPRHEGQAEAVNEYLRVRLAVLLECSPENAILRIESDSGGDRDGRKDGDPGSVARRLDDYQTRTFPMARYYVTRAVPLIRVPVGPRDSGAAVYRALMKHGDVIRSALEAGNIR